MGIEAAAPLSSTSGKGEEFLTHDFFNDPYFFAEPCNDFTTTVPWCRYVMVLEMAS